MKPHLYETLALASRKGQIMKVAIFIFMSKLICQTGWADTSVLGNLYVQSTSERNWNWGNPHYEKIDGQKLTVYPSLMLSNDIENWPIRTSVGITPIVFYKQMSHSDSYSGYEGTSAEINAKIKTSQDSKFSFTPFLKGIIYSSGRLKVDTHKKSEVGAGVNLAAEINPTLTFSFKPETSHIIPTSNDVVIERDILKLNYALDINITDNLSVTPSSYYRLATLQKDEAYERSVGAGITTNYSWSEGKYCLSPSIEYTALGNSQSDKRFWFEKTQDSLELGIGFNASLF